MATLSSPRYSYHLGGISFGHTISSDFGNKVKSLPDFSFQSTVIIPTDFEVGFIRFCKNGDVVESDGQGNYFNLGLNESPSYDGSKPDDELIDPSNAGEFDVVELNFPDADDITSITFYPNQTYSVEADKYYHGIKVSSYFTEPCGTVESVNGSRRYTQVKSK